MGLIGDIILCVANDHHTGDCQFSALRMFYLNAEGSDSISAGQKLDLIPRVLVAQSAEA
jgi:hypothetical protein